MQPRLGLAVKETQGETKTAEEKEHERVAEGPEGYVEVLLNASETVVRLKSRFKRIVRKFEQRTQILETQYNLSSLTIQ